MNHAEFCFGMCFSISPGEKPIREHLFSVPRRCVINILMQCIRLALMFALTILVWFEINNASLAVCYPTFRQEASIYLIM